MKSEDPTSSMPSNERWLDAALSRALSAPSMPPAFRAQLDAALTRAAASEVAARSRLELERRERLAELEASYVRLRRRTLGTLIGGAFAAGAAAALAMPWLNATFGANAMLALAGFGALVGLAIAGVSWLRRTGLPSSLNIF